MNISHTLDHNVLLSLENYKDIKMLKMIMNCMFRNIFSALTSNLYTKLHFIKEIVNYPTLFNLFVTSRLFNIEARISIISTIINDSLYNNSFNTTLLNILKPYLKKKDICKIIIDIIIKLLISNKQKSQNIDVDSLEDNFYLEFKNYNHIHATQFSIIVYNYLNKSHKPLFNAILYSLDYGIINILEEKTTRKEDIEYIEHDIYAYELLKQSIDNGFEDDEYMIEKNILDNLYFKKKLVKYRIRFLNKLDLSIFTINLNTFINECIKGLLDNSIAFNDILLNTIIRFKYSLSIDISQNGNMLTLSLIKKILDKNTVTSNDQIKIYSFFFINNRFTYSDNNYFRKTIFKYYCDWFRLFIENTILLKDDELFCMICLPHICYMIHKLYSMNKTILYYLNFMYSNKLKHFIYVVINNYKLEYCELLNLCKKTKKEITLDSINKYNSVYFMGYFIKNVSFALPEVILCLENRYTYFEMINIIVETISNTIVLDVYTFIQSKINHFNTIMFNFYTLVKDCIDLYYVEFLKVYSIGFLDFDKYLWKRFIRLYNQFKDTYDMSINRVYVDSFNNQIESNKKIYEKLPDKFMDPLTFTVIDEPIMVQPNTIMDRGVIYKHLMDNSFNPFNRDPLTIKTLNRFNDAYTNILILEKFKLEKYNIMYS